MKKILLLLCAAICTASVTSSCCGEAPSAEDAVLNNIMTRASVRSYTPQAVEQYKIDKLLKAGMAAPTGSNKQPWEFVVITDRAILNELPSIAGGMRMAGGAPLAIVVLGDESISGSWTLDCSAATQNILLAAHAMGLGAVWCGAYPENESGRTSKMKALLNLPEGINALNAIIIGYPDSESEPKDKWKPEKVHYQKY
ncbi:MAG: nitroreductase family protein [Rikenellaceae bacterium]